MVSTLVSDAIDPSSILGKTSFFKSILKYYNFNNVIMTNFINNCIKLQIINYTKKTYFIDKSY